MTTMTTTAERGNITRALYVVDVCDAFCALCECCSFAQLCWSESANIACDSERALRTVARLLTFRDVRTGALRLLTQRITTIAFVFFFLFFLVVARARWHGAARRLRSIACVVALSRSLDGARTGTRRAATCALWRRSERTAVKGVASSDLQSPCCWTRVVERRPSS